MGVRKSLAALGAAAALSALLAAAWGAKLRADGRPAAFPGDTVPTPEQLQALLARAVENQHRDDRAIYEFERVEHVVSRTGSANSDAVTDHTDRVMPSGTGTMRLPMARNGSPVRPEEYREGLKYAVRALELALHPNERERQAAARFERRSRDRAELVDAAAKAFRVTWAGRETRPDPAAAGSSRTFVKLILDPDPDYKPPSRFTAILEHVHAVLWLDESQAQAARLEADITSDINFGGGIIGKVYRGGHFVMEQSEIAPGVWLPASYTYDVDGRKFLFSFSLHERTDSTRYRHLGPPAQAIEIIRNELNNLTAETPAH